MFAKKQFGAVCLYVLGVAGLGGWASVAWAEDKSGARPGLYQLPGAGGTIEKEVGAFVVQNNTGAAAFSLLLPTLPAPANRVPEIALRYSQHGESSGFGIGWALSVPAVEMSYDYGIPLVGFSRSGAFRNPLMLDQQRLVFERRDEQGRLHYRFKAASQDAEIIYHPEAYVIAHAREVDGATPGIAKGFEVILANGMRQLFSGAPSVAEGQGDHVTRWPLRFEVTPTGESTVYHYEKHAGRSYLKEVAFAGGKSRYTWDLIDSGASPVSYKNGFYQAATKLYSRLVASFDGDIHAQWCLAYLGRDREAPGTFVVRAHEICDAEATEELQSAIDPDALNVVDQLARIYRLGDDATLTPESLRLPALGFDYSSWTADHLRSRDVVYPAPSLLDGMDFDPSNYEMADVNMDGLVDVVRRVWGNRIEVSLGTGTLGQLFGDNQQWSVTRGSRTIAVDLRSDRFHLGDINGDSYVDVVEFDPFDGIQVYLGGAEGEFAWTGQAEVFTPARGDRGRISASSFAGGAAQFVDLNADGRTDLLTTRLGDSGKTVFDVYLNRSYHNGSKWRIGLFRREMRYPWHSQQWYPLQSRNIRVQDINGDQLPDYVEFKEASASRAGICVYANQGDLYSSQTLFGDPGTGQAECHGVGVFVGLPGVERSSLHGMWFADVNGDGIVDYLAVTPGGTHIQLWLGSGELAVIPEALELATNIAIRVDQSDNSRSRAADIDGDGMAEIVVFPQFAADPQLRALVIDFNRTADKQLIKSNLLTTVRFSSGLRHDIRYATSTDEIMRDQRLGQGSARLHFPVVVAKEIVTSEGSDATPGLSRSNVAVTELFYHQPFYDPGDRRFLGFGKVERVNYGDEYLAEAKTQRSVMVVEQYHIAAGSEQARALAGQLRSRQVFTLQDTAALRQRAQSSSVMDPSDPAQHSLSSATQLQSIPVGERLLQTQVIQSDAVERGQGGWFVRVSRSREQSFGSLGEGLPLVRESQWLEYDEYNIAHLQVETQRQLSAPFGVVVPAHHKSVRTDYTEARATLVALGIVSLPNRITTKANNELIGETTYTYYPNGLIKDHAERILSRLETNGSDAEGQEEEEEEEQERRYQRSFAYDAHGNQTGVSDHLGAVETLQFDPDGVLPLEHTQVYPGDSSRNLVSKMVYDGPKKGLLSAYRTPMGLWAHVEYDSLGRRSRRWLDIDSGVAGGAPAEQLYRYRQGTEGRPTLVLTQSRRYATEALTPAGEATWQERLEAFRSDGQLLAKVENSEEGGVRVLRYHLFNRQGNKIFTWVPYQLESQDVSRLFDDGVVGVAAEAVGTRFQYDALGRMTAKAMPSGKQVQIHHYAWGTHTQQTYQDPILERVVAARYDVQGVQGVVAVVEADESLGTATDVRLTRFVRDGAGHLSAIRLPGEAADRTLVHDNQGRLEHQAIPGLGERFWSYDLRGRLVEERRVGTTGAQEVLKREYDAHNRLIAVRAADGLLLAEYGYDRRVGGFVGEGMFHPAVSTPMGKLTWRRSYDANGLFDYQEGIGYDMRGFEVVREVNLAGSTYTETYGHTLDGVHNRTHNPFGLESQTALGRDGRLKSVSIGHSQWSQPTSEVVLEKLLYNPTGQLQQIRYRQGAHTTLSYSPETLLLQRIESAYQKADGTVVPLQDLTMLPNENGAVTSIVDAVDSENATYGHVSRSGTFVYNWRNELVSATRYGNTKGYDYNAAGNFTYNSELDERPFVASEEDGSGLLPLGTQERPYQFDGQGRLVASPWILATEYDTFGRLIMVQTAEAVVHYGYSPDGARVYQKVQRGDESQLFLYPLRTVIVGPNGSESFVLVAGSRLVRMENESRRWFYYLKDHLGSSDVLMTAEGVPVEQMLYQPYGTEREATALSSRWQEHLQANAGLVPREDTKHRFTGQHLDDGSGLYYFGTRYYDPHLGRFITPDAHFIENPERCVQSVTECNLYGYAANNPMMYIDPNGEFVWVVVGAAIGVGVELFNQMVIQDKSLGEVEVGKVILSGAVGALGVGLGSVAAKIAGSVATTAGWVLATEAAINIGGSAAIGMGSTALTNWGYGEDNSLMDAALYNGLAGGVGWGFGRALAGGGRGLGQASQNRAWQDATVRDRLLSGVIEGPASQATAMEKLFIATGNVIGNGVSNSASLWDGAGAKLKQVFCGDLCVSTSP